MLTPSVFCLAISRQQAGQIVDCLKTTGFAHQDISVLLPAVARDLAPGAARPAAVTIRLGATTSGESRGARGWIPGFQALAIPEMGSFLAAGPIGAALHGAPTARSAGVMARTLMGFGLPDAEARRYEAKVAAGDILVAAHTANEHEIEQAQEIFVGAGAGDVCLSGATFRSRRDSSPRAALWHVAPASYAGAI